MKIPRLRTLGLFVLLWLPVGFTLGTMTLLGPVRWVTNATREAGFSPVSERAVVLMMIVGFVGASALVSLILVHRMMEATSRVRALRIPGIVTAATALALWAWFTPSLLNRGATMEELAGSKFTFGPYPEEALLAELAEQGYTHVVSLLHPAVVPFEPMLLSDERENVQRAGLELVHAPMLPWVGENTESLATIRQLAESGEGRYYVHCYLGRDRVGVVKRLIRSLSPTRVVTSGNEHPLAARDHLERGKIHRPVSDVFFTPFPTDEEMLAYFMNVQTGQVVSLLDPDVESNLQFMEHERAQLAEVGIPLIEIGLPQDATPEALAEAADRIRALEGVTLVHRFRSDDPISRALSELISAGSEPPR